MRKIISLSAVALLFAGCVSNDVDDYRSDNPTDDAAKVNLFDFSTVSEVKLTVDYSASKPTAPIFFKVYSEDPFDGDELNENIKPVYAGFTDADGLFSQSVELPSYATDLYVFTGDFFVNEQLMEAKVTNNAASAVAGSTPAAARRALSQGSGVLTDDLSNLYQLSYLVDYKTGDKLEVPSIYNEWKTWLGKWDSRTGRPDYLLKSDDEQYSALTFDEEDMKGIRQSLAAAIVRKEVCPMEFRQEADLTLQESSAVSVTFVGSNTCWNNTLGYYYYQGEAPKNLKDIHVVMLFPNTQDGLSQFINNPKKEYYNNYNGNIALERGETVQLIYYPYIAQNNMEDATPIFPKGTKIGFLMKANGWGMQKTNGNTKYFNGYKGAANGSKIGRQYNCWSASTDGLSYCEPNEEQNVWDKGSMMNPNPERVSRTAKFAYEKDGQQYAIVALEDAANDVDYGDVILALKPVGVFQKLPVPTSKAWSSSSVYAYEDLWPSAGDYDMNDALVEAKEDRVLTMFKIKNRTFLTKQTFNLTTYQNYVTKKSGLALTLEPNKDYIPTDIKMKKILPRTTEPVEANFIKEEYSDGKAVYLLTDDIKKEINTTYIMELTYEGGVQDTKSAKIKPFIYCDEEEGKRWEVHIPKEAPTAKMNTSYFGTMSDKSKPAEGLYYVGEGNYPFAFQLAGVSIDAFENTILLRENEKKAIDVFFPEFTEWSTSNGTKNKKWYLHPVVEQ